MRSENEHAPRSCPLAEDKLLRHVAGEWGLLRRKGGPVQPWQQSHSARGFACVLFLTTVICTGGHFVVKISNYIYTDIFCFFVCVVKWYDLVILCFCVFCRLHDYCNDVHSLKNKKTKKWRKQSHGNNKRAVPDTMVYIFFFSLSLLKSSFVFSNNRSLRQLSNYVSWVTHASKWEVIRTRVLEKEKKKEKRIDFIHVFASKENGVPCVSSFRIHNVLIYTYVYPSPRSIKRPDKCWGRRNVTLRGTVAW